MAICQAHKSSETHLETVTEKGVRSLNGRSHISTGLISGGQVTTIYLYPGGKSTRIGAFFETYKEAWHLLKQPETSETEPNNEIGMNPEANAKAARVT
jgi:hypothetical protein